MIVQQRFQTDPNSWVLVKTFSDAGMMIRQDESGDLYAEAVDPEFTGRTYTETNIPIDEDRYPDKRPLTAEKAYDVGDYLYIDGIMHRVILPILAGGFITIGTNVVETTVSEELSKLNKEETA